MARKLIPRQETRNKTYRVWRTREGIYSVDYLGVPFTRRPWLWSAKLAIRRHKRATARMGWVHVD